MEYNCKTQNCPNKATHGAAGLPAIICAECAKRQRPDYVPRPQANGALPVRRLEK